MKTILKHQAIWRNAEIDLQNQCNHANVEEKYKGNSGNYDTTADSYWIEFKCSDCGKFWIKDQ